MKFWLAITKNLLSARAANYFLVLPKRHQPSHLYFFIKKVKDNMSPLSSWQYPSCFRKGQIRQLLRTLTAYFYVSSSSLVVWAVDGRRTIHRILKHFTIFVSYIFPKSPQKKKSTSISISIIFKKVTWLTFHFIMCACAVTGRGNDPGKIASWSIKTSTFFGHGSEEIMVAVVNFYQSGSALSPAPFARHYSGTDREQDEEKNTAI